jgi:hypothetical protein
MATAHQWEARIMSRNGTPMYAPAQEAHVIVSIERDGTLILRTWHGSSIQAIHRAARKQYEGARVTFGNGWYTTK